MFIFYQIIVIIIGTDHLPCVMTSVDDPMLRQHPLGREKDRIADLLPARGRRRDLILRLQPSLADHVLHHKLRHRTPADIPVADKQYLYLLIHNMRYVLQ